MFKNFQDTFTFDDVLLVPQKSTIVPADVQLHTKLTNDIILNIPFLSAPMDTVTEHKMAITLALSGGIGIIHKNMSMQEQVEEVLLVKRFENGFIDNPVTVKPEDSIKTVAGIREKMGYKKVPVVDDKGILIGLISNTDYFVPEDNHLKVKDRMSSLQELGIASQGITLAQANKMIRERRLKVLCIIDKKGKLVSIVSRHDMEKNEYYPDACKNESKQLRVGAAIGVGKLSIERAEALIQAGVDVLVIDTAHGHSDGVIETLKILKKKFPYQQMIVGNIATSDAAKELISAGADAVKVGIGPGSICTTRIISGVGVPQLSAVLEVVKGVQKGKRKVPIIADGGIKNSGDITKALAAGANCVMMGNIFAGTDETPGKVEFRNGKMFKVYRGMGSLEAMDKGSKDRYGQANVDEKKKLVPEGVSGRVIYKGQVNRIIYQLSGGVRSGMGYCGAKTVAELQKKAVFVRVSHASLKENHPHDLGDIESAPNYSVE